MLVVETIAKIRRAYYHQRKSIKQICRELKVSRKVVRKVIRSGKTDFSYERAVQPEPKIGPWRDELDRMLAENVRRAKRGRLTLVRIFEASRGLGYAGGYDAVRRYAATWNREVNEASASAFVPLSFDPGWVRGDQANRQAALRKVGWEPQADAARLRQVKPDLTGSVPLQGLRVLPEPFLTPSDQETEPDAAAQCHHRQDDQQLHTSPGNSRTP